MGPDERRRIANVYQRALDLPESERDAFLDVACADPRCRREVADLLAHYAAAIAALPAEAESVAPAMPASIRHFELREVLGEGGMGTVYLADQQQPMARRVALKVIRPGLDSQQVLARFRSEQRALAILEHPAIARVFEAGTTEDGRPYFAMEHVPGPPITEYCDRERLDPRQRVVLFLDLCAAIHFAHQKGIIHRDIKPGNVLVAEGEDGPAPKVIDFGIAKIMATAWPASGAFTLPGQLVGTLEYMSPEQAAMDDVDTRTDVYALGLLLYELLAGKPPFTADELRAQGGEAMLRFLRETDPPRPSLRVSTLGAEAAAVAGARRREVRALSNDLRGDLDWIVLKALARDRDRRYDSASALAADLRRHLADEPVVARPPSLVDHARKFTRRHRTAVGLGATIVAALFAVLAVTLVQGRQVALERDRARAEATVAHEVSVYLGDLFHDSSVNAGGADATTLELLDAGVSGLRGESHAVPSPAARVRLLRILGTAYVNTGQFHAARPVITEAVALAEERFGADHLETADSRYLLVAVHEHAGRFAEAAACAERVLPVFERELGPRHVRTNQCRWALARLDMRLGSNDAALAIYRKLLADTPPHAGPDRVRLAMVFCEMGVAHGNELDYAAGIDLCAESLRLMEGERGPEHPYLIMPLVNLVMLCRAADRRDEALAALDRLESVIRTNFGAEHAQMTSVLANRGWLELDVADHAAARPLFEKVLALQADQEPDRYTTDALLGLGVAERELGRTERSREYLSRALSLQRDRFGPDDVRTLQVLVEQARTEDRGGRTASADSLLRHVIEVAGRTRSEDDPVLAAAYRARAEMAWRAGRHATAESLFVAAHGALARVGGPRSSRAEAVAGQLRDLYADWGRPLPEWLATTDR